MNETGNVTLSINNGIAELEFYHPKSNSLPGILLKEIADKNYALANKYFSYEILEEKLLFLIHSFSLAKGV